MYNNRIATIFQSPNQTFVGNNAVAELPIVGVDGDYTSGTGLRTIPAGESLNIEKIFVSLPYQYGLGQGYFNVQLWYRTPSIPAGLVVTSWGGDGNLMVPAANCWVDLNFYFPHPGTEEYVLELRGFTGNVSQINAPAILNGVTLNANVYLLVGHTYPAGT